MRLFSVFATAQAAIGDGNKRSFAGWNNCINEGQNLVTVPNAHVTCTNTACVVESCYPGYHRIAPNGEKKERQTLNIGKVYNAALLMRKNVLSFLQVRVKDS